jgi:putative DNA primase/helicase
MAFADREMRIVVERVWEADPELRAEGEAERARHQAAALEIADARPPEFSDEALALRFAAKYAGSARFVAEWGKWLLWTGSHWSFDSTMRAFDMARAICRVASAEVPPDKPRLAPAIASAKTVAAVISLARADRRHAATVDQWDSHPWLLNTPNGIVDLLRGTMLQHDRERYMTKITSVAPGGPCPLWRKFLAEITAGDTELEAFLQRIAGYSLTGSIRDHALFFAHGTGGNGKGVFLNTMTAIMAGYAAVAPMETFIASRSETHPTDLAGLRGARLVTAQETEQGRRWAESKIKALTGGDPISARFMRQDFFTYLPHFKLVIAGNHKPGLRGVDEAIRRRFNLLPFTVTIANPDTKLPGKLQEEWPGILQWAIEGCLEWQRVGLAPPAVARQATDDYLAAEDAVAQWLEECCCLDKIYSCRSSLLFANWKAWAEAAGEFAGSQKRFTQTIEARGFARDREGGTGRAIFRGLAIRPSQGGEL